METIEVLNVTEIEPRFKHPKIFEKFDSLIPGASFCILNDHDPKPLYYQLLAERGKTFDWKYLENGPEIWKVSITKNEDNIPQETIGEAVAKDYRKAQVFKKFGIDFCCGGKKTLDEVCSAKGLDISLVKQDLESIDDLDKSTIKFDKWGLDFLVDYIITIHHSYVKESLPFIVELANKVARVHGDRHPEAIQVASVFERLSKDFELHLLKEENILFPFIRELVNSKKEHRNIVPRSFGSVDNPVQIMEMEHEQAGEDMLAIRNLTSNYTLPEDACTSYAILYKKLEEFENDLFNHVHLENNILFPKASILEKEVNKQKLI